MLGRFLLLPVGAIRESPLPHWSQVKKKKKKSSKQINRVKLIENKQFSDFISLWVRVKD